MARPSLLKPGTLLNRAARQSSPQLASAQQEELLAKDSQEGRGCDTQDRKPGLLLPGESSQMHHTMPVSDHESQGDSTQIHCSNSTRIPAESLHPLKAIHPTTSCKILARALFTFSSFKSPWRKSWGKLPIPKASSQSCLELFETGSHYVASAGLERFIKTRTHTDLSVSASQMLALQA